MCETEMNFATLINALQKRHMLTEDEHDAMVVQDQIDLMKKIEVYDFKTVKLHDDVFHLYNNMTEVVNEIGKNNFFFDVKKAKRVLQETMSYPEVVAYISEKFDELTNDDSTEDNFNPFENERGDEGSSDSESNNESVVLGVVLDKIESLSTMTLIGNSMMFFVGALNIFLTSVLVLRTLSK